MPSISPTDRSTRSAWLSTRSTTFIRATATASRSISSCERRYYPSFGKPDDGLGFGPEMVNTDHGSTGIGGISFYTADQYPEAYRGTTFIGNVVTNRINHDRIEWHGSSPRGTQQADFVWSEDNWFHPVDIELGPDGALYVADFYNRDHRPLRSAADAPGPRPHARADLAGRVQGQRRQARTTAFRGRSDQVADRRADQGPGPPQPDRANHGRQPARRPRRRRRPLGRANSRGPRLTRAQRVHALWVLHRQNALDDATLLACAATRTASFACTA